LIKKKRKTEFLKNAQNVAGSVGLSLFMDGTGKYRPHHLAPVEAEFNI
jgi:hypothetical protein